MAPFVLDMTRAYRKLFILKFFWQVTVSGLRIRVRLDEGRITELLKGLDGHANTTAGLLNCIGDLATISFAPQMAGVLRPSMTATEDVRTAAYWHPLVLVEKQRSSGLLYA